MRKPAVGTGIVLIALALAGCQPAAAPSAVAPSLEPAPSAQAAPSPTPASSPSVAVSPASSAPPGASPSAASIPSPTAGPRHVKLGLILATSPSRRFERFGSGALHLARVWSAAEGLGGSCEPSSPSIGWLECGLIEGLIHRSRNDTGPALGLFVDPASGVKIPERAVLPGAWVQVIGHFGDPSSDQCAPGARDDCRDRFVVESFTILPS
jgi:hypothetical protein